jgi:hypothetical protein
METNDAVIWLTGLVLEAAKIAVSHGPAENLVKMGTYKGVMGPYEIFGVGGERPLAETRVFRFYVAKLSSERVGLVKIATTPSWNGALRREAEILRTLQNAAIQVDSVAVREGRHPFNYGAQFPEVIEEVDADGRLAMFLGYHPAIASYKQLFPLALALGDQRIDLKTSVWVLGKLLRLLDFIHRAGFSVGRVDASNVLIEKDLHGVVILDFSNAGENPNAAIRNAEVADAARMVWQATGGTEEVDPPHDAEIMGAAEHSEFVRYLQHIVRGETKGAGQEHATLYTLADGIWPLERKVERDEEVMKRPFHEWTTYSK